MAVDNENPYASPACPDAQTKAAYISRHQWRGRTITVEGAVLPSRLWMVVGYVITIDGEERFETAQLSSHEDFRWQFVHQGSMVTGRFETFGFNNGIVRKYRLTLDGERLGPFKVRLNGWWIPYLIGIAFGLAAAAWMFG